MRCRSCDVILNDYESTRRYIQSDEFIDLCSRCFCETDIEYSIEREDLIGTDEDVTE